MLDNIVLRFDESVSVQTLAEYHEQLGYEFPIEDGKLDQVRVVTLGGNE